MTTSFLQGDLAIIEDGITEGEHIIVNDLVPAVEGMLISASHHSDLQNTISLLANGEGALK